LKREIEIPGELVLKRRSSLGLAGRYPKSMSKKNWGG